MRKLRLLSILIFAFSFVIVSCSKEGPEGPPGTTGAQGPSGNTGLTGATGVANVIYSAWITDAVPALWADTTMAFYGSLIRRRNITAPGITQTILDQGVVLSYVRFTGNTYALPFLFASGGGTVGVAGQPAVGRLIYILYNPLTGGAPPGGLLSSGLDIRYIIIPGGVLGGRGINTGIGGTGYSEAELRAMSYENICTLFKIQK